MSRTLNEIASKNNITPKNLQNWKKIFLENAEVAMEPAKVVKEYKEEITVLQAKINNYTKIVGKITLEKEWLEGKLVGLDLLSRKKLVDNSHSKYSNDSKENSKPIISIFNQCKLLKLNRSSLYYKPLINKKKTSIKEKINDIYKEVFYSQCQDHLKIHSNSQIHPTPKILFTSS